MKHFWYIFLTLLSATSSTQGCRLWICDAAVSAKEQHAMLVHSNGSGILYPDKVQESWEDIDGSSSGVECKDRDHSKAFDIPEGESVIAACPGEDNKLRNFEEASLTLTCHNGGLLHNNMEMDWTVLKCLYNPKSNIKEEGGKQCGTQQGYTYTIGWEIEEFFIPHIEVCFNKDTETTLFTHHFIYGRYYDGKEIDSRRPDWIEDIFSVKEEGEVTNLYKQTNQKEVLREVLGSTEHISKFWVENRRFLARGHLAPDADFVTEAEQDATYYFANVVPQWNSFNGGNWLKMEDSTQRLAENRELTLSIWTGSNGVLHLPDEKGNAVPIYLGLLEEKKIIPVPEIMWKVVYNPSKTQGVVFIGLNNANEYNKKDFNSNFWNSLTSIWHFGMNALRDTAGFDSIPLEEDGVDISDSSFPDLCKDICSEIKWVNWDEEERNTAKRGKMICCSVQDAKQVIQTLPEELQDTSLLV